MTAHAVPRPRSAAGPVRISAVVIAKDEAEHVPDLAASLAGAVDEVVLVDTGSTDDTVALAEAAGFRVFSSPWTGSFAEARNESLRHARGDWALWVDADERLVVPHPDALRDVVAVLDRNPDGDAADAFWVGIESYLSDDLDPDLADRSRLQRFFRAARFRFVGRVHERLQLTVPDRLPLFLDAPAGVLLRHLGYTPSAWASRDKLRRNEALVAAEEAAADDPRAQAEVAFERARIRMEVAPEQGVAEMVALLDRLPRATDMHRLGSRQAARWLIDAGRHDEALTVLRAVDAAPGAALDTWVLEGMAHAGAGRWPAAARVLRRIDRADDAAGGSPLTRSVLVPALRAQAAAGSGRAREAWDVLSERLAGARADELSPVVDRVAALAWERACAAGRPDTYLDELAGLPAPALAAVVPHLDEAAQRALGAARHLAAHPPVPEPDPRLPALVPSLAAAAVPAALELAAARLDSEPALALGIARTVAGRADATADQRRGADLLAARALLLLGHAAEAARAGAALHAADPARWDGGPDADDPRARALALVAPARASDADIALVRALHAMAAVLARTPGASVPQPRASRRHARAGAR